MARALPITIGAAGIASLVTGATLLSTHTGIFQEEEPAKPGNGALGKGRSTVSYNFKSDLFKGVDNFKENAKSNDCVKNYFGEDFTINSHAIDLASGVKEDAFNNKLFKSGDVSSSESPSKHESCLIINWDKETFDNSKWKGTFNWIWTFVRGDEGFINFNIGEITNEQKLKFTGAFYLVEKTGSDWKTAYKKEVTTSDEDMNKDKFDTRFPKVGSALPDLSDKPYWGFVDKPDDVQNICKSDECTSAATKTSYAKKFKWTPKDEENSSFKDWTEKLKWWDNIYSSRKWKLEDKISTFKGTWAMTATSDAASSHQAGKKN